MKFYLQEPVVRGKQIQIPIHGGGGWVSLNTCWSGGAKDNPGKAVANEIAKILRAHGYEFEFESSAQKRNRIMLEKREARRISMCEHANEKISNVCPCKSRVCYCKSRTCKGKS